MLSAAATLFEQRGFAGVTMTEVARLARISKTTLYTRYPTKALLFRAICSYACRVSADHIASVVMEGRKPAAVLADFGDAILTAMRDEASDRFLRLAIFEAPRFPDLAEQIYLESRVVAAPLTAYFTELVRQGRLSGHDPASLADQFVALITGGHGGLLEREDRRDAGLRVAGALALILPLLTDTVTAYA
ncbi:TetR/AcrR family transcriptional regulator [Sphingobium aromaticiconvertens]|uniref:TetR/AcrR family transcriptional regulator n=1 Tax=Sphingobium aromaticiconvertens TaxID=365341 RepID=UPI0030174956